MNPIKLAKWCKKNKVRKLWFLTAYSFCFGILFTIAIRLSIYFSDVYIFGDQPRALFRTSDVILVLLAIGLGLYFAIHAWNDPKTSDREFNDQAG